MSLVQDNLMTEQGYSPYCAADKCSGRWPRTRFNGEQFKCRCGWVSDFTPSFIAKYKAKWGTEKTSPNRSDENA